MSAPREACDEYLALRRALGCKLTRHGRRLPDLIAHLAAAGETTVTTRPTLEWQPNRRGTRRSEQSRCRSRAASRAPRGRSTAAPAQAHRQAAREVPDRRRGGRAARGAGPIPLDRTARSRAAGASDPNRITSRRSNRPAMPTRASRSRPARSMRRERKKATRHPAHQPNRSRGTRLA
jgi:hypothetical protein